jgi:hypothetical protein
MEDKTREVRRSPKRGGWSRCGGAHRGRGRSSGAAQIMAWDGGDSTTDADERSKEGEGHLRRAPMGEWGWEGKKGGGGVGLRPFLNGTAVGQGREEGGRWHGATRGEGDGGAESDRRAMSRSTAARL